MTQQQRAPRAYVLHLLRLLRAICPFCGSEPLYVSQTCMSAVHAYTFAPEVPEHHKNNIREHKQQARCVKPALNPKL